MWLHCINDEGDKTKVIILVSVVKTFGTINKPFFFIPVVVMKLSILVTKFQKLNYKACLFEHGSNALIVMDDLVTRSGMIFGSRTTDFYHILIPFVSKIGIRHRTPNISAWF